MIALLFLLAILSFSNAFKCSVSSCAYLGARATCCPSAPCLPVACAVWHATLSTTFCNYSCPSKCLPPSRRPIATDAIAYCNLCTLIRASCKSGFDILGPIDYGVSYALDVEVLSTPTILPPSPLPVEELEPLITPVVTPHTSPDLPEVTAEASPEETPPSEVEITPFPRSLQVSVCSVDFCSRYGADVECKLGSRSSTCGGWSAAGDKSECLIFCNFVCIIGPAAPLGSDGRRYCSLCQLRSVSCRSGYVIYGPINGVVGPNLNRGMLEIR